MSLTHARAVSGGSDGADTLSADNSSDKMKINWAEMPENLADPSSSPTALPPIPESPGQGAAAAASPDPSLFPPLPVHGSDNDGRGVAGSNSRWTTHRREENAPPCEEPIGKKVAKSPNETGAPRTDSGNHVENVNSFGAIIDDPGAKDTSKTDDAKMASYRTRRLPLDRRRWQKRKTP